MLDEEGSAMDLGKVGVRFLIVELLMVISRDFYELF